MGCFAWLFRGIWPEGSVERVRMGGAVWNSPCCFHPTATFRGGPLTCATYSFVSYLSSPVISLPPSLSLILGGSQPGLTPCGVASGARTASPCHLMSHVVWRVDNRGVIFSGADHLPSRVCWLSCPARSAWTRRVQFTAPRSDVAREAAVMVNGGPVFTGPLPWPALCRWMFHWLLEVKARVNQNI